MLEVAAAALSNVRVDGSLLIRATAPLGHMQAAAGMCQFASAPLPPPQPAYSHTRCLCGSGQALYTEPLCAIPLIIMQKLQSTTDPTEARWGAQALQEADACHSSAVQLRLPRGAVF